MSRAPRPPRFQLSAPAEPAATLPELALAPGVRLTLEGSDLVAVEAAVAEMRARFGSRFAVTDRRLAAHGTTLRITASLRVDPAHALDAGGG